MRQKFIGVAFVILLALLPVMAGAEAGKSPDDPIPAGEPAVIGPFTVTITGWNNDATDAFQERNAETVEQDLPDGSRYIIIDVTVMYDGDDIARGTNVNWHFIGPEKAELSEAYCPTTWQTVVNNAPETVDIFPGGTVRYQHCAIVPDDAVATLQPYLHVNNYDYVFMSLPKPSVASTPLPSPAATPTR